MPQKAISQLMLIGLLFISLPVQDMTVHMIITLLDPRNTLQHLPLMNSIHHQLRPQILQDQTSPNLNLI